ncbi:Lrp/AsnC family transcriptional regulator [Chloroflexota bacterium]
MQVADLSTEDRAVINKVQHDLPLNTNPFTGMSGSADMDEERFMELCRSLRERGIMRRYGAAVNHRRVGYAANAMACVEVMADKVDIVGKQLASLPEVSHCYERKTNTEWQQNLFAMIHGHDRETCYEIAGKVSTDFNLPDFVLLFSTRELKKTRIKYSV